MKHIAESPATADGLTKTCVGSGRRASRDFSLGVQGNEAKRARVNKERHGDSRTPTDKDVMCPLCESTVHVHEACPLAAFVSQVSQDIPTSYIQRLQQVGILKKRSSKPCIPIQDVNTIKIEGKGNCLFASIWYANRLSKGLPVASKGKTRSNADNLRKRYLARSTKSVAAGKQIDRVPLRTFVEASADKSFEAYLSIMQHYGESPSQWGGFAEGCILASWQRARVFSANALRKVLIFH